MSSWLSRPALSRSLQRLLEAGERRAARCRRPVLVSTTLGIPSLEPLALFRRARVRERALWEQPAQGFSLVAVGAAARLTARGEGRFSRMTAAWRGLLSQALVEERDGCPIPGPICLGGFAFDPAARRDGSWRAYPDALLLVPQVLLSRRHSSCWLTVNAVASPGIDPGAAAEELVDRLCRLLPEGRPPAPAEPPAGQVAFQEETAADGWMAAVAAVVEDIRRGAVEKLVLARRARLRAPAPLDPGAAVQRLRDRYGSCTLFAIALGEACFLGATPERLVRLEGRSVRADCLAGSMARGASEEEDRALGQALLTDAKERHEHALVVRSLREALAPLCSALRVPESPHLLRMANVQHLHTPVEGVLKGTGHILELVGRLHPTPAAGGLPRQSALPLIRRYEPFERGWYAGPVGWVDGRGGGEFVVAIRSALLRGQEALLYAGCGIVAGSDPEREYRESCLKLRPMSWALVGREAWP